MRRIRTDVDVDVDTYKHIQVVNRTHALRPFPVVGQINIVITTSLSRINSNT